MVATRVLHTRINGKLNNMYICIYFIIRQIKSIMTSFTSFMTTKVSPSEKLIIKIMFSRQKIPTICNFEFNVNF